MSWRMIVLCLIVANWLPMAAFALDPEYHTLTEIYDEILNYQQTFPDTVRIDTIGYSQQDHLPIWAVKLSDNVQQDEDEPTVLFVGQVHAEELPGVEVVLGMMEDILSHRFQNPYRTWLQFLEIWIVPTANPEGHLVVTDSLDLSFRKNKRDLNNNGIFDYNPGMGGDLDGVDLNRNFPLNWVHGDTFLQPGGLETYDYFRGYSPLSESECQTLWDFCEQEKFGFCIVWHTSRTTNYSEKIFYPWNWNNYGKTPPDFALIDYLGIELATLIPKISGVGHYDPIPSGSPSGNLHDSFYAYLNTVSFLIECCDGVQPAYFIVEEIIADNLLGAYLLLNRASGYGNLQYYSQITGTVKDTVTNQPLPAVVTIPQLNSPYLKPRTCDPLYGRYRRYVMPGTYDIVVSLKGYEPQNLTGVLVNASGATVRDFLLQPKEWFTFNGEVRALNGDPLEAVLYITGADVADTVLTNASGLFYHTLPAGDYQIIIDHLDHVVHFDSLSLQQNRFVTFTLSEGTILFFDDFEGGLNQWQAGGTYNRWGVEASDSLWNGSLVATESPGGEYLSISENWIELAQPLDLSDYPTASLRFQHWYYFEPGYDSAQVQVSSNGGTNWFTVAGPYYGQDVGWGTGYVNLDPYCGNDNVRIRFLISTDENTNEQGWRIDHVEVMTADTVVAVGPTVSPPRDFTVTAIFPNPFNAELNLQFTLPQQESVEITLWDLAGREIARLADALFTVGSHRLSWRPEFQRSSGLYFLRIRTADRTEIRKVMYLK
ncbi:MAG: M14 family zinc carboxypeptidase [bacterium]